VFECQGIAASRRYDAQIMLTEPAAQRDVEGLHKYRANIMPHPFIENIDQEATKLHGAHRALGDQGSGLRIEPMLGFLLLPPSLGGGGKIFACRAFDDRYELNVPGLQRVAEETIDFKRMILIGAALCPASCNEAAATPSLTSDQTI